MKIMAGILAASIVIGNGHWLASAQEVGQTEAEVNGEIVAAASTATVENAQIEENAAPAESTPPDTGSAPAEDPQSGGSADSGTADEGNTDESGGDTEQNTGDGQEDNSDEEQQDNTGGEEQSEADQNQQDNSGGNSGKTEGAADNTQQNNGGSAAQNNKVSKTEADTNLEANYPAVESDSGWSGDSTPGWADSDQEYISGNLEVAEQIRLLESQLRDRVSRALVSYKLTEDAVTYEDSNFLDIFAVYAVKHDMTDNFPYDVEFNDQDAREELLEIFNQMTRVNKVDSDNLTVRRLTYEEVMDENEFDDSQKAVLADLVNEEAGTLLQDMYDTSILSTLSDEEFAAIEEAISQDVSGARRSVLLAALSLEGKINYFWGGKSYHVGWDQRWGQQGLVTADGSSSTGTVRSYGMDCSGFVSWAFINGGGDQSVLAYIGNGTANQFSNSYAISWEEAQPGDLLFYKAPNAGGINHVGIVVSNDEDGLKVVHCSSGKNGVVVTGKAGFQYVRRPYIYSE